MQRHHPHELTFVRFVISVVCIVLASCVSIMPTPSERTLILSSTASATARPTASLLPTNTARPSALPTQTPTKPDPATPHPTSTAAPHIYVMKVTTEIFKSPVNDWLMKVMLARSSSEINFTYARYRYDYVTIENMQSGKEWVIVDEWTPIGLGEGYYEPLHWSADGEHLYITYRALPDGCWSFVNGSNLIKVDLKTGEKVELAPRVGLYLSLSPDETQLAFIGYGERGLVIRNLVTGRDRETGLLRESEQYGAGLILWSPDRSALVLTLAIPPCSINAATSIVRIDLRTLEKRVLVPEDERKFISLAWDEPERVLLRDKDGKEWWLNPDTGELVEKP